MNPCRGRGDDYEYVNVPGGQWRTKLAAAELLCAGCPVIASCAHDALKSHALGMVWAGVPIPDHHNAASVVDARLLLVERARGRG